MSKTMLGALESLKIRDFTLTKVIVSFTLLFSVTKSTDDGNCLRDLGCTISATRCTAKPCSVTHEVGDLLIVYHTSVLNAAFCIAKCRMDAYCTLALFVTAAVPPEENCLLMSNTFGNRTSIPFSLHDKGCTAFTIDTVRCLNCGIPQRFSCSCPFGYYGRLCEFHNPAHCQSGRWTGLSLNDLHVYKTSESPFKVEIFYGPAYAFLFRLDKFHSLGNNYLAIAEPNLFVDHQNEDFANPARIVFTNARGTVFNRVFYHLNGSYVTSDSATFNIFPHVMHISDPERLKYNGITKEGK